MRTGVTRRDEQFVLDGRSYRVISTTAERDAGAARFVLVHGVGTSHRYFARLHDELARDADTVSVDLPGFGGVAKPDHVLEVAETASGLAQVLDALGAGPYILVGHSMGTQWVVELAAKLPLIEELLNEERAARGLPPTTAWDK
jgi:pimeloyl-ACP methyl ester carboxylesterase